MNTPTAAPRFQRSSHLVALIAEVERLAAMVAATPGELRRRLRDDRLDAASLATLQLDGSPVTDVPPPPPPIDDGAPPREARRSGTWLDAMAVDRGEHDETLLALEFAGARAGLDADDLAEALLADPLPALAELHRRTTRGLLAAEHQGQPRRSEQAVHDASVGRILYFTAEPDAIPGRLALLGGWLVSTAAREHAVVASGVLHHELLHLHPFEAANGRVARTAARLVLRARGLDPDGLGAPELALAGDPLGYHEEVARTVRRRDLTIWLERWGEAVADGLRGAARALGALDTEPPDRAVGFVEARTEPAFTIADYRAGAGVGPEEARADLEALLDAELVARVPASRGLRFHVATSV